jgi:hypothetical protein
VATGAALNGAIEIAGPENFRFDELTRQRLAALNDPREVIADPQARYFGAEMSENSLVPIGESREDLSVVRNWRAVSFAASFRLGDNHDVLAELLSDDDTRRAKRPE